MKSLNLHLAVVVFFVLYAFSSSIVYAKNNQTNNSDPLGEFISKKKLMKSSASGEQSKTKLNLSNDPMAQFMVDQKMFDLSEIEFVKPTEKQLSEMKKNI